jgi:hypothetical protein
MIERLPNDYNQVKRESDIVLCWNDLEQLVPATSRLSMSSHDHTEIQFDDLTSNDVGWSTSARSLAKLVSCFSWAHRGTFDALVVPWRMRQSFANSSGVPGVTLTRVGPYICA